MLFCESCCFNGPLVLVRRPRAKAILRGLFSCTSAFTHQTYRYRGIFLLRLLECSVGTVLFTALGISVAAICAHGAFHVPDEVFTDDPEVRQCFSK